MNGDPVHGEVRGAHDVKVLQDKGVVQQEREPAACMGVKAAVGEEEPSEGGAVQSLAHVTRPQPMQAIARKVQHSQLHQSSAQL